MVNRTYPNDTIFFITSLEFVYGRVWVAGLQELHIAYCAIITVQCKPLRSRGTFQGWWEHVGRYIDRGSLQDFSHFVDEFTLSKIRKDIRSTSTLFSLLILQILRWQSLGTQPLLYNRCSGNVLLHHGHHSRPTNTYGLLLSSYVFGSNLGKALRVPAPPHSGKRLITLLGNFARSPEGPTLIIP